MSESSTLKLRPASPLSVNRNMALNSALSWKVWLKLEDEAESINQPFSLTFGELDTVDDLKTKIFANLNTIRWSRTNDNASIALGFYSDKGSWDPMASEGLSPVQRLPASPIDAIFGKGKAVTVLQQPATTTRKSLTEGDSKSLSLNTSPRISASTSPKLSAMPRVPSARYGTNPTFLSAQGGNNSARSYGLLPSLTPLSFSGSNWPKKNLKHTVEQVSDSLFRVIFEPDELVITIYNEMFGHMGAQAASEALLVFCSDILRQPTPLPFPAMNTEPYPPKDELSQELFKSQTGRKEGEEDIEQQDGIFLQPGLETPPQAAILNPEDAPPELLLEHTASQLAREENEREFQLITNEEQLRKVSQSMQDEDNPDSPKQAILLLPKDFDGCVNFKESPSKLSSQPHSPNPATHGNGFFGNFEVSHNGPVHDIENSGGFQQLNPAMQRARAEDALLQPHVPLSEKEVGMVHPMLESDRKKGLSSPTSPLLPRNPPPNFSRLSKSFSNKDSSSPSEKNFPSNSSTTSDKVFPKINVLIVEDNVINQTILSSFLRKHKIFYKVAKNGQEAIDIWKQGNIHLIFMDLQLPVLSGIDAAKKIRELERQHGIGIQKSKKSNGSEAKKMSDDQINAPVIIVAFTASKSQSDKREALISGCNDYLTKPVNLHWLSNKINEWGCMQALINFDSWKEGQSRMTDNVLVKAPSHKSVKNSTAGTADITSKIRRRSRSSSGGTQSKTTEGLHLGL